jgi:DNA (cytosine-5)-methyltransferase 1
MRFIDLFAGLGGFHLALRRLGHECVYACELDEDLADLYEKNFGLRPRGDVKDIPIDDIPRHDILCAGFPCQPFSKAGDQQGFDCPKWGNLFEYVIHIIDKHKPTYFILENVPNIEHHNSGQTWVMIKAHLKKQYEVDHNRLSPHRFGIPQIRERMFIVGSRSKLDGFKWPDEHHNADLSIKSVLDDNPSDARKLSQSVLDCLEVWQEFLDLFPQDEELPSFPIWSMEFGATYPFEEAAPYTLSPDKLRDYRGSHGQSLRDVPDDRLMESLPSYARPGKKGEERFPAWKIQFIRQNRELYRKHRGWIDGWKAKIIRFPPSFQKFEWNCKREKRCIWDFVIQCRASGVRVKRPTTAPSLVAMTTTQVPIIAWEKRYMTPLECARLQSMDKLTLPKTQTAVYKALGNAVNVDLVEMVARRLLSSSDAPLLPSTVEAAASE